MKGLERAKGESSQTDQHEQRLSSKAAGWVQESCKALWSERPRGQGELIEGWCALLLGTACWEANLGTAQSREVLAPSPAVALLLGPPFLQLTASPHSLVPSGQLVIGTKGL